MSTHTQTQTQPTPTLTLRPSPGPAADAAPDAAPRSGSEDAEVEETHKFDYGPPPPTFDDPHAERAYLKERLALAYRVLSRECNPEGAAGHLSVRDPVDPDCFWVCPSPLPSSPLLLFNAALPPTP